MSVPFSELVHALSSCQIGVQLQGQTDAASSLLLYQPEAHHGGGGAGSAPSSLVPHLLACVARVSGIVPPAGGGDGDEGGAEDPLAGSGLEAEVARQGLENLLAAEDVEPGGMVVSMLASPSSLHVLTQLLQPETAASPAASTEVAELVLRVLQRVTHSHPRSVLRSGGVHAALAAATGCGDSGGGSGSGEPLVGTLAALQSSLAILSAAASEGAETRADAACLLDAVVPLVEGLHGLYVFASPATATAIADLASSGGGNEHSGGSPPPLVTLTLPTVSGAAVPLANASVLVGGLAALGLTNTISRLCALAQGHWRQWAARYAESAVGGMQPPPSRGGGAASSSGGMGGGGCYRGPVPANWPFAAVCALVSRGLLPLWAAALAAHAATSAAVDAGASGGGGGGGGGGTPTASGSAGESPPLPVLVLSTSASQLSSYSLPSPVLQGLLLALARVLRVLRFNDCLRSSSGDGGGSGGGGTKTNALGELVPSFVDAVEGLDACGVVPMLSALLATTQADVMRNSDLSTGSSTTSGSAGEGQRTLSALLFALDALLVE